MPQLFSRMDDANWLTPSIADILDQGAAPPGGDGTIREQILSLQTDLAALETPARVVNVRPTPSYTLFIVQPETVGRLGSRRTVTVNEIRRSIGQIAERRKDWRLGFLPQVDESPDACGIMLRTEQHRPLSLRRLLVRGAFRDTTSTLAYTLGVTLDQRLVVRDFEQTKHLLIIGEGNARAHLVNSLLLTTALFNTPAEVKLFIAGESSQPYAPMVELPHADSPLLTDGPALTALLAQMAQEVQTRLDAFYEEGVNVLTAYNNRRREQGQRGFPHLIIVIESLSEAGLSANRDALLNPLRELLLNGGEAGIHFILTVNTADALPDALRGLIHTRLVLRSAAGDLGDKVRNFHSSLLRFVDGFVVEDDETSVTPVELCAISADEIASAVAYWAAAKDSRAQIQVAGDQDRPAARATGPTLATRVSVPAEPLRSRAAMLAAYLGWLSIGALHDIFGLSDTESTALIASLQADGVLEASDGGMARFVRLAER